MTDKYSGQVVFAQMKAHEMGEWSEKTTRKKSIDIHTKRRLRNMVISTAAVFCLGIGVVYLSSNRDKAEQVMSHVTTDFEYDETLGRLQFVSSILPESAMVFLEGGDSADAVDVFMPVDADIEHVWSQEEPWLEFASTGEVRACSDGDVMTVVRNRDDEYTVRLMHNDGYESVYSGLTEVYVEQLDSVFAGEQIGTSSKIAAFELRKDGLSIMPQFEAVDGE